MKEIESNVPGIKGYTFEGNEFNKMCEDLKKENRDERTMLSMHDWALLLYSDMLHYCTKNKTVFRSEKDFNDLLDKLWIEAEELYTIIDFKNYDLDKLKQYVAWTIIDIKKLFDMSNRHNTMNF